ncbi:hypothetical protein Rsub_03136 [Raphidocelis subcapitata]|uniref:C2 domain-containing protein n=1 Tax=Raphidocelis subcapitata TaxID=307507 RepID=A0A2V0NSG0_9CHLO|nr:hypothetical protein Rsub_03136 [Raphidocelis subcapitata]|eukprot:GBF90564.1 hypothetical protein Rsub_03136 [Raphidocelis subcapitata]
MVVTSHPLRLTERDVLQEESVDEWFASFRTFELHVRLLCLRDLAPANRGSLPNPYAVLVVGGQRHRTPAHRRRLDADFGEEWALEWGDVDAARRRVVLEIWSWELWRADELLGRAFIDVACLAFEPLEVLEIDLQLYPPNVKAPPPLVAGPARALQRAAAGVASLAAAASFVAARPRRRGRSRGGEGPPEEASTSGAGAPPAAVGKARGQRRPPGEGGPDDESGPGARDSGGGDLSPRRGARAAGAALAHLQQQLQRRQLPPSVGQLQVAVWWAPARPPLAADVAERCSFCLLPGEAKVPPVLAHSRLGELYEEPCLVYVKLQLLEVLLGGAWYSAWLGGAATDDDGGGAFDAAAGAQPPLWWWQRPATPPAGPGAGAGASVASEGEEADAGPLSSVASSAAWFLGGADSDSSPPPHHQRRAAAAAAGEGAGAAASAGGARPSPRAAAVFALARVSFGRHQRVESRPVRVSPGGRAAFLESFVFCTKRPLKDKRVVLEVILRGEGLPGGRSQVMARADWSSIDLLLQSPPPPTTWLGVHAARQNRLPGMRLPLSGLEGARAELLCHAADADLRASAFGVPALTPSAAAAPSPSPRGGGGGAGAAAGARGAAIAAAGAERWTLLKQLTLRRRAPAASVGGAPPDGAGGAAAAAAAPFAAASAAPAASASGGAAAAAAVPSPVAGLPNSLAGSTPDGPLARLQLVLHRVDLSPEPKKGYSLVVKCGPHWARARPRRGPELEWQLEVPIYHPTALLVAVVYSESGRRGRPEILGKSSYRISSLLVISGREQPKSLRLRGDARDERGARVVAGTLLVSFRCDIPDRRRLLSAYSRSPYPPTVHLISLWQTCSRDATVKRHHDKLVAWLAAADPPVPQPVARKVLETGREQFRVARARYNIRRFKEALNWLASFLAWMRDLRAWRRPWYNLLTVFAAYWVCFHPRGTLLAAVLYRSAFALRRLWRKGLAEYLGVELGELLDTAGLLPDAFGGEDYDSDDDPSTPWAWPGGGGGGGGAEGAGGDDGGAAAAAVMFRPRRLRALKRRYEQLLRVSLQVQNRIDDLASGFERLAAAFGGQDPLATAVLMARLLLLAALLWALGAARVAFAWWCLEALRPPSWRGPPGIRGPLQFLSNLPSRSAED